MIGKVLIDVAKCIVVVVVLILCHMHVWIQWHRDVRHRCCGLAMGPTWRRHDWRCCIWGGVPRPKRIWLFSQSKGQLRQALRVIMSSSSAPTGRIGGNNSSEPGSTQTS